jgi:hypothetical protein
MLNPFGDDQTTEILEVHEDSVGQTSNDKDVMDHGFGSDMNVSIIIINQYYTD